MRTALLVYLFFIAGCKLLYPSEVTVSHSRGYYQQAININLNCEQCGNNEIILYTLDNNAPTLQNATTYAEPIEISKTTTLKISLFDGQNYFPAIAHTYIFLKDVLNADYMDSDIINDEKYADRLIPAFTSLPTISISTKVAEPNTLIEKDLATSVEIFNATDIKSTSFNCGIETWGGSSYNLKKHYRLEFKEKYGDDELKLKLFEPVNPNIEPVNHFNRLLLRSASQDGLNSEFCDEAQAQFIRNRVLMDAQLQMDYPAPHGKFVQVFFNQQYIGLYHLMERPDADFFKDYYFNDVDKDSVEVRKNSSYLQQPHLFNLYDKMLELSNENLSIGENYNNLSNILDLKQTAVYLLLNHYAGNFDFAANRNNLGASTINNSYKFILWDVDLTLGNEGVFEEIYGDQLKLNNLEFTGPIPARLVNNNEFKHIMADALYCNCFNHGILTKQNLKNIYQKRANEIKLALVAEAARWGNVDFDFNYPTGHYKADNWEVDVHWKIEIDSTLNYFIENRTDTLISQYKQASILNDLLPVKWNNDSTLQATPITLINPNNNGEIYYTINTGDPRAFGGVVSTSAKKYVGPFEVTNGTTIIARVKVNNIWSAACPKTIYTPQPYNNLIINEIHYAPSDSITINFDTIPGKRFEFIELYNNGEVAIDLTSVVLKDGIQFKFNKSSIIEPHSYLVLAADSIRFFYRYGFAPFGEYKGNLSNEGEAILLKTPFNTVFDSINYQIKFPWPNLVSLNGASLSLLNTDDDNQDVVNWKVSKQKNGTPGKINFDEDTGINTPETFNQFYVQYLPDGSWSVKSLQGEIQIQIDVYDLQGSLVAQSYNNSKVENNHLQTGIYILNAKSRFGVITQKVVRQ